MAILIENVLDVHTLEAITELLMSSQHELGSKTAGPIARAVKDNRQYDLSDPMVSAASQKIEQLLLSHPVFIAAAQPLKCAKILFNRYDVGMTYGEHVDEAFMHGVRTDLSFTLFLSDPADYQGGELVIKKPDGPEYIKLAKGSLYLYPSTTIHAVAEVTSGTRLAAVGWVQSRIKSEQQRDLLFDLISAIGQLPEQPDHAEAKLALLQLQNNLQRLWAD